MSITRYGYRDAISGFFEFPTDNARRILPRGVEPVEPVAGLALQRIEGGMRRPQGSGRKIRPGAPV